MFNITLEASVRGELERVQDWRQEDFCNMKARDDQDLNLGVALGAVRVERRETGQNLATG